MDPYIGEIRMFASNYAPRQWALCEGQELKINDHQALYSLIGTTYGGDGHNTFKLPDLRCRIVVGQGQGTGLTKRTIGQTFGTVVETITAATLPVHSHALQASNEAVISQAPSVAYTFAKLKPEELFYSNPSGGGTDTKVELAVGTLAASGGNLPHDNVMSGLVINFIIALEGMYPGP